MFKLKCKIIQLKGRQKCQTFTVNVMLRLLRCTKCREKECAMFFYFVGRSVLHHVLTVFLIFRFFVSSVYVCCRLSVQVQRKLQVFVIPLVISTFSGNIFEFLQLINTYSCDKYVLLNNLSNFRFFSKASTYISFSFLASG